MKEQLLATGGILGAVAASACCIIPLALVSAGVSGAWIANLTALAPYQPIFVMAAVLCLGAGFWLVYRRAPAGCESAACRRSTAGRFVISVLLLKVILWAGAGLVAMSLGVGYGARVFL